MTDIGVVVVFALGYYLIRYIYGDRDEGSPKSKSRSEAKWQNVSSIEEANQLIKHLDRDFNPFEVLDILNRKQLTADINTYNSLLNSCYTFENFEIAEKITDEVFDQTGPVQPNQSTYNILLKGICCRLNLSWRHEERKDLADKADWILSEMTKTGIKPNDITLNTAIDIFIKAEQSNRAWDLFDSMKSLYNVDPDKYTYSTIIKVLKLDPSPERLEKVFAIVDLLNEKQQNGSDEIIFNCLIDVCVKLNKIEKAEMVFLKMKSLGVVPSRVTYGIMIKAYGSVFQVDKAFEIYRELKENTILANDVIYGCLLNACVKSHDIARVYEVYSEMKHNSIGMNIVLYCTLIKAYTKVKDIQKACEVYESMKKQYHSSQESTIAAHNAMLDCCVECNDIGKMSEIYYSVKSAAIETSSNCEPDLITYSTVIKGYARSKQMDKVLDVFNFLIRKGFQLDEVAFNSILDGCVKAGFYDKALEVYGHMANQDIRCGNVTYSIMVKLYSNMQKPKEALRLYDEMLEKGLMPGVIVFTCLIQMCFKQSMVDKAVELFEKMKRDSIRPDHVVYNTVVNGLMYHRRWQRAFDYALESFANNVKMANGLYNTILDKMSKGYCDLKHSLKSQYATALLREMKKRSIEIDDDTNARITKMLYQKSSQKVNLNKIKKR